MILTPDEFSAWSSAPGGDECHVFAAPSAHAATQLIVLKKGSAAGRFRFVCWCYNVFMIYGNIANPLHPEISLEEIAYVGNHRRVVQFGKAWKAHWDPAKGKDWLKDRLAVIFPIPIEAKEGVSTVSPAELKISTPYPSAARVYYNCASERDGVEQGFLRAYLDALACLNPVAEGMEDGFRRTDVILTIRPEAWATVWWRSLGVSAPYRWWSYDRRIWTKITKGKPEGYDAPYPGKDIYLKEKWSYIKHHAEQAYQTLGLGAPPFQLAPDLLKSRLQEKNKIEFDREEVLSFPEMRGETVRVQIE
jgi:hypothetical protein